MNPVRFLAIAGAALWAMTAAEAGPVCATAADLKLLKAAVLEQALAAAAQSCRLDGEFSRFVAAYRDGMVASDKALQAFFAKRKTGEGYDGYKARIAGELSAASLHDPKFCAEAKSVFDIALRHGKAPVPHLSPTGYEACGMPGAKIETALALRTHPQMPVAPPLLSPAAQKALAPRKLAAVPVPQRKPAVLMARAAAPARPVAAAAHVAMAKPAAAKPVQSPPLKTPVFSWRELPPERPVEQAAPPPSFAGNKPVAQDRPSRQLAAYGAPDPVPDAYKPGAVWVVRDGPPTDHNPPRGEESYMVLGPDGHWIVVIARRDRWHRD